MNRCKLGFLACALSAGLVAAPARATTIFTDSFDTYTSGGIGSQASTGLAVHHSGNLTSPAWTKAGGNAVHAVDRTPGAGVDYAVQIFSGTGAFFLPNTITLTTGILANALGVTYLVDYEVGPTVWATSSQATSAADGLVIEIRRGDNSILASDTSLPGGWTGAQTFSADGFSYVGDGSGAVRIHIRTLNPNNGRFAGAIDNLSVSDVPEPLTLGYYATAAIAGAGIAGRRRRRA